MITLNNISNLFKGNYINSIQSPKNNSVLPIKNTNLSPLSKDTVSFTSRNPINNTRKTKKMNACKTVNTNMQLVQMHMEDILSRYFNNMIYDKDSNPYGIINPIKGRVKTPESIFEKVEKRNEKAWEEKPKDVFSPYKALSIMANIKDASGTQITIRDIDTHSDEIIDKLCKMIKKEGLIVDEIENHSSKELKPYFSKEQLDRLFRCVNEQRKANNVQPLKDYKNHPVPSGYMALHLTFNFRNRNIFNDAELNLRSFHELQIIGSDVGSLKEVEDFCYKLTNGDDIMQGDYAYDPFVEYFYKYHPEPSNKSRKANRTREAFKEYTRKAYAIQRKRKPTEDAENDVTNWAYRYPTIKECGLEGDVPPELDFNILARLKRDCDDIYKVKNNAEEILGGQEKDIDNSGKITYRRLAKKA